MQWGIRQTSVIPARQSFIRNGLRQRAGMVLLLAASTVLSQMTGCAEYQIRQASSDPPDLAYKEVTSHAFFWGLVYDPEVQTVDGVDGINDVIVVDNLGYDIISVVTLGIWKPMTIRYRARLPHDAPTHEFPVPPPSRATEPGH